MPSIHPPIGRIGYVLKRYPRFSETFIVNEILAHEAVGQEIDIFALRPADEAHYQDILGRVRASVTHLKDRFCGPDPVWDRMIRARDLVPGAWDALAQIDGIASGQDVAQALELAIAIRARGITHLHAHFGTVAASVTRLAAAMADVSWSFTAHAKDIYHQYETPQHLDLKLQDADVTITVSDYNLAYLQKTHDVGKLVRIYNGLDLTRFQYAPPRMEATEILAVGRLVEKKGFHILVEAIKLMVEAGHTPSCTIIGSGEERDDLAAQITNSRLGEYVRLEGPRPQSEVIEAMRGAAVLACPCVIGADGNRDGLPTVLVEAMALGLPVVSTNVVGIPELVRDRKTGLIVPDGDPQALADALVSMAQDPALRASLSKAARNLIEAEYDVTVSASALRCLWAEAIARQSNTKRSAA
ncbi:glycosyltransferase [Cognatiyoonia sp. IB215182]|uniref:glycosyltransferase n=1 Tax=Cognatiyoonia sp. IB215182 TaxID=3097353 RepID=UPI002A0B6225|nr:glycosyltransferase [Cognatiyoonia sp. IB215182]MDX8355650.1 glycosyltransferase [Cognatiyoonia sp. IB215182]